jgi:hypothetical protein
VALLDTGSSGLRVIAGAVPSSALASTTTMPTSNEYHSGVIVDGVVAMATVE